MSTYLVIAHQTASSPELREALLARSREDRRAIFVLLVPATPLDELAGAPPTDAVGAARQALTAAMEAFEKDGLKFANGFVGDPDPFRAVQAELERAGRTYDGIVLCTLPFGVSPWLSRDLPGRIEALFGAPLMHVTAPAPAMRERAVTAGAFDVVTLTVRLGSRGDRIGQRVAERLGYRYYDWEVTSRAAEQAGVPPHVVAASEQAKSFVERVMERLMSTGVYDDDEAVGRLNSVSMASAINTLGSRGYRSFIERVVLELASAGNAVIVGHASQVLLAYEPRALRVLVTGSPERRAERVAADEGRSIEDARKAVRESDEERRAFFRQTYNADLLNADLYDLTLNTDRVAEDTAVEAIATLAGSQRKPNGEGRAGDADIRGPVQLHG